MRKGSRENYNNYRRISLFDLTHKIVARMFKNRLEKYHNGQIGKYQRGFKTRKHKQTYTYCSSILGRDTIPITETSWNNEKIRNTKEANGRHKIKYESMEKCWKNLLSKKYWDKEDRSHTVLFNITFLRERGIRLKGLIYGTNVWPMSMTWYLLWGPRNE